MVEEVQQQLQDFLSGASTVCPSDEKLLFYYVSTNQIKSLKFLISTKPTVLYYNQFEYPYNNGAEILTIACNRSLNIEEDTVQELINLDRDRKFDYKRALFTAVVNPKLSILEVLIRKKCDINATYETEDNALHHLIKHLRDLKVDKVNDEESFVKHVKLLLVAGIDVNKKDHENITAIVLAAENKFKSIVKTLLDESKDRIELDDCVHFEKTAREWIEKENMYNLTDYDKRSVFLKSRKDNLFVLIKARRETVFLQMFETGDNPNEDDGKKTFLQYSCETNCLEIIKFLCEKGADIEKKAKNEENEMKPLRLALDHGYHKIVKFLVEKGAEFDAESLSFSIKKYREPNKGEDIDYKKCFDVLVNSRNFNKINFDKTNFNEKDKDGNTPLYNSVKWGFPSLTEILLKNRVNLGIRNEHDLFAIHFINPDILEKHLDSCIESVDKNSTNIENYKIILKLDTLIAEENKAVAINSKHDTSTPEQDIELLVVNNSSEDNTLMREPDKPLKTVFNRETTVIHFMANTPELKHLLKHPVIVCFLKMKWHRIRWLFFINLIFYAIFGLSLNTYIYMKYTNFDTNSNSGPYEKVATTSFVALIMTYLLLWLRELFQFVVSPKRYLKNRENYIEFALLIILLIILFYTKMTNDVKRQLSPFVIIFSAFQWVLMLGHYSGFTTHVIMFKRVLNNFVRLFLWYSVLIFAFALSFIVLFTKSDKLDSQTNSSSDDGGKKEGDAFTGPGPSLFKTLVMLTGELDASSIDFHAYPVVSHIIFMIFVFTIPIILFNLLNGLAVSDTQAIKNDAELIGHIARAELIDLFEASVNNIINVLEKNRFFKYVFCCSHNIRFIENYWKFRTERLCLFTISNNDKNIFISGRKGCLTLDGKKENTNESNRWNDWWNDWWNNCIADKEIFQKAKIIAKRNEKDLISVFDPLKDTQDGLKIEFDALNEKLNKGLYILENIKRN